MQHKNTVLVYRVYSLYVHDITPNAVPMEVRMVINVESRFSIAGSAMPHQLRIVGQLCYPEVTRSGEAALRYVTAV